MRRILVVGMSGSGKTTAARRIAERLNLPFFELDMLAFGPDWSRPEHFVESVEEIVAGPAWVIDSWGDEQVRDAMWGAADTVVWLDYRARVVIPSLLRRSLLRSATRVEIFNGNRETWLGWLSKKHPVWHALCSFQARRDYLADRTQATTSRHLRTLRFLRRSDFEHWLAELTPQSTSRQCGASAEPGIAAVPVREEQLDAAADRAASQFPNAQELGPAQASFPKAGPGKTPVASGQRLLP